LAHADAKRCSPRIESATTVRVCRMF
jgi:hypothetical protein